MKPNRKLAETTTPDGAKLILYEHDGAYCIRLNGQDLMHSSVTASELRLGELAAETLSGQPDSLVLLGGLGLGFTLKSLLAKAGPGLKVQVAESDTRQIVDWNRKLLAHLNGALLDDPRVEVVLRDVWTVIVGADPSCYDALVLDLDNGPTAMVQKRNARLYNSTGLEKIAKVLKPHGRTLFWSARPDPAFAKRLGPQPASMSKSSKPRFTLPPSALRSASTWARSKTYQSVGWKSFRNLPQTCSPVLKPAMIGSTIRAAPSTMSRGG